MKNTILFICWLTTASLLQAQIPSVYDLRESGKHQRRDLSIPGSRIVINPYNFGSSLTAVEYSNRSTMPLNIAYLSTLSNDSLPLMDPILRFSRQVDDLLTIRRAAGSFEASLKEDKSLPLSFETEWMPHELPFFARYEGETEIKGRDFFFDSKTVVREIKFSGSDTCYYLSGKIAGSVYDDQQTIFCKHNHINYAIQINGKWKEVGYRNDAWYVRIDSRDYHHTPLIVSIAFADKGESRQALEARVRTPFLVDLDDVAAANADYWHQLFNKVPQPIDFSFETIDPKGVSPDQLRLAYYKAWVFTSMNLLEADSELFPYPQMCTGKPSLWCEGSEAAPFSAAWESFLGIQLYAYIDPKAAWDAFKGLLSLVEEDGMLGGESLPSRKAQTAMVLYRLTGDKESLRETYPAIKRYMEWRLQITHWVYREHIASPYRKDAEFAFSALIDMEYLQEIALLLGESKEAKEWKKREHDFLQKCYSWFWETPGSMPCQIYDLQTGKREWGHTVWVCTGLHVSDIQGKYAQSLLDRFDRDFDTDKPFGNFDIPKYPDVSYTVYGLLQRGYDRKALETIEVNLRDICRAHASFAEQYIGETFRPDGVRPSLFGSSMVIDFVLLMNNFRYDKGQEEMLFKRNLPTGVRR
ncbi:hypothetical protein LJC35_06965 [Parabacteroides sp. OttesenSCG-928-N08]|nr:hypothetical protein [Parabacteroides sp. OttesenSCG-928-N08]